jgi:hypothetical protein
MWIAKSVRSLEHWQLHELINRNTTSLDLQLSTGSVSKRVMEVVHFGTSSLLHSLTLEFVGMNDDKLLLVVPVEACLGALSFSSQRVNTVL